MTQELATGDSPADRSLQLKARLVLAHLPPHHKLAVGKLIDGSAPHLRVGSTDIPVGGSAILRCRFV